MEDSKHKRFTLSELKEFDGKEGRPAYIAFKGKVYDISESVLWKDGWHQGVHLAGGDLTESIVNAPHNEEKLSQFKVIGELNSDEFIKKGLIQKIESFHPHAMLTHFPIAFFLAGSLLSLLFLLTGKLSLETVSYGMLAFGFLSSPFAFLSGLFTWKVTYRGSRSKIFIRKIALSIVLMFLGTVCFLWRAQNPDILIAKTASSYIYMILIICLVPTVSILGHYGGKIVYSSKKIK